MKSTAFWLLLCSFSLNLFAQCNQADDIIALSKLTANTRPDADDKKSLEQWVAKWDRCRYAKDSSYIAGMNHLALACHNARDDEAAIEWLQKSVKLQENSTSPGLKKKDLVMTLYFLSVYYSTDSQREKSVATSYKTIALAQRVPEAKKMLPKIYLYLTFTYLVSGNYGQAMQIALQGEKLAAEIGDTATLSRIMHQRAQVLEELGRNEEAIAVLQKSIGLIGSFPDLLYPLAIQRRQLGQLYQKAGKSAQGLKELLLAYEIGKAGKQEVSDFPNAIGSYYSSVGDYKMALRYFNEAIQVNSSSFNLPNLYDHLGSTYVKMGDYPEALKNYQKALTLLRVNFSDTSLTSLPDGNAIRMSSKDKYFLSILQNKAKAWLLMARKNRDDPQELQNALKTCLFADRLVDFMRQEHSEENTKLTWRDKTRSMYEDAIEAGFRAGQVGRVFFFFEKSRSVLLNDRLNELNASQKLDEDSRRKEEGLRKEIGALQDSLKVADERKRAIFNERLLALQRQRGDFLKSLERTNPQYYAYKYENKVPTIAEVQNTILKEDQAMLSFFVGDRAVYGLAISRNNVVLRKIDLAAYQSLTTRFNALIGDPNAQNARITEYCNVTSKLYQLLIKPFNIPEGTRVVVSPDGGFLPFGALSRSSSSPDYLVRYYAFSYAYSAGFLKSSVRQTGFSWARKTFLGIAPVEFAPVLKQLPLPGSGEVLGRIQDGFFRSSALVGSVATKTAFMRDAPGYSIVQLLTHASADSSGSVPTLYFADSTLKLNELNNWGRSFTDLIILSACQTGVGKNQRGEGVFSLARGFAGLGIPSILTTLWSVENQATYRLTEGFFEQLKAGRMLDRSLQSTQITWLDQTSASEQLPYVWAGIVLVGNVDPVDTGIAPVVVRILIFGIAILAGWLIYRLRFRKAAARDH